MAQIYGELIRAQLQSATSGTIGAAVPGLVYFNSDDKKLTLNDGTSWQKLITEAALAGSSSLLPIVPLTKGGLGVDASSFLGLFRVELGVVTAGQINVTDIPDLTVLYSKLDLADGDIPQVKVANLTTDLAAKMTGNAAITGDTKAKITYDSKGLVTAGADLVAADLPLITPSKGGTGVANNDAATLTRSGNHALTLTTTDATGVTLPTAGTLATLAGSEQLSSKTLVEPVVDNFAAFNQESTPAAAAAGTVRVYAKADNKLYKIDSTGAEASIGSGSGSGGVNYLVDWYDSSKPIGTVSTVAAGGNIVVSGSAPAVTSAWYADTTSGAAAIASSTSTLLRGSSNYLTALSGTSTSGATFVQSAVFNIDGSDLGKPVTISFDLSGVTTANDWDVVVARYTVSGATGTFAELIPVAGTASSMTGTPSAQLPTGTVQFKGFFIPSATSTDVYAVRLRRRAGATQIRVDSLTVGPQSLAQGAVVTAWQSYTPTVSNIATSAVSGRWRRIGDSMSINGSFTPSAAGSAGVIEFSIPSGFTVDSSKIVQSIGSSLGYIGSAMAFISVTDYRPYHVSSHTSTTLAFSDDRTGGVGPINGSDIGNGNTVTFIATIPISEWSSGTTTLADRAVEEYAAATSGTWDANATAAQTIYGPEGAPITGAISVGSRNKVVRFQSPILPTDKLFLEIYNLNGNPGWVSHTDVGFGIIQQLTQVYGAQINPVNAGFNTDCLVYFYQYMQPASNAYGGAGQNWVNGLRWRLRKVSGGAAVGFPVSARNIVGDTSGTAVPAGYIGEVLTSSGSQAGSAAGTVTVNMATGVTLTPGTWMVFGWSEGSVQAPRRLEAWIIDGSNVQIDDSNGFKYPSTISDANNSGVIMRTSTGNHYFRVASGSTQIVKTQCTANFANAGGTIVVRIQAVRIA
jgi:hypothetical protein